MKCLFAWVFLTIPGLSPALYGQGRGGADWSTNAPRVGNARGEALRRKKRNSAAATESAVSFTIKPANLYKYLTNSSTTFLTPS